LPLYASNTKFDSGTGWPSFYDHLPHAVLTRADTSLGMERTEVLCARCEGHLGHVFDDGPRPTGLRYCMNGLAMRFEAA
jgi:peptide-methionine (R)-S-oxide reductase